VSRDERRDVPRDRGIGDVRQAELDEGGRSTLRPCVEPDLGEEAVDQPRARLVAA
jgi:hypothetical protein